MAHDAGKGFHFELNTSEAKPARGFGDGPTAQAERRKCKNGCEKCDAKPFALYQINGANDQRGRNDREGRCECA
jgi:hypothetical protein